MAPCQSASIAPSSRPSVISAGVPLTISTRRPAASAAAARKVSAGPRAGPAPTRRPSSCANSVSPLEVSAATWKLVSYIGQRARTFPCFRFPAAGVPCTASQAEPRNTVPSACASSSTTERFCSEPVLASTVTSIPRRVRKAAMASP